MSETDSAAPVDRFVREREASQLFDATIDLIYALGFNPCQRNIDGELGAGIEKGIRVGFDPYREPCDDNVAISCAAIIDIVSRIATSREH